MSNIKQFDLATAALEHLELLNQKNQNPLEIAAQFRILLRSNKEHSSDIDYIPINTTTRISHHPLSNEQITITDVSKCQNMDSIEQINGYHYPIINWKQLRKKQYKYKLEKYLSTKFKPKDLTSSSLTTISDKSESYTYSNISALHQNRSSSPLIRTPSISPIHFPQPTYTISKLNSTAMNDSDDDIFFPIADCNLIIKHRPKKNFSSF